MRPLLAAVTLSLCLVSFPSSRVFAAPPRLIVLVSVDQWPAEYLERFGRGRSDTGLLARIQGEGAWYDQCHHRHAYTLTGPGHATLLTGAHPAVHGIIGNSWYDRPTAKSVNCVQDDDARIVGGTWEYNVSPKNLLAPTLGDQLKLSTSGAAKVFGIAVKDRAAVLMAGRLADAAYWLDDKGQWVTSDHYRSDLPGYLRLLNEAHVADHFAGQAWNLLRDASQYHLYRPDDNPFEQPGYGMSKAFPHTLPAASDPNYYEQLTASPFANELLLAGAERLLVEERLGTDDVPDLLAIGVSSPDYVGHNFGPYSLEVEDMFHRTDERLGQFARVLDERVGAGHWTLALTSDHGVAPNPEFAKSQGLDAGRDPLGKLAEVQEKLEGMLSARFPVSEGQPKLIEKFESHQLYLRRSHPALIGHLDEAESLVANWLREQPAVVAAVTRHELVGGATGAGRLAEQLGAAFHPRRSGDVLFVLAPYYVYSGTTTATHGSPWRYDTHVPLMLVGAGVHRGAQSREVAPGALAATFARLLRLESPAAAAEPPLLEAVP